MTKEEKKIKALQIKLEKRDKAILLLRRELLEANAKLIRVARAVR